ncbi:MAG: glycosyltransferase family 4 protein [bacterium]|nr:glycosyltransferase family 4 protein [bacterium]
MNDRIRILVITHNYPRFEGDFAGVFLHLLMRQLPQYGVDPIVIAPHDSGAEKCEEMDGVRVYRFQYADRESEQNIAYRGQMHQLVLGSVSGIFKFKSFLDRFRMAAMEVIKKEKIELLAGHWLIPAGLVMKPIAKRTGLPTIMSSHGTDIRLISKYAGAAYRYLKSFCRQLRSWTFVSSYLRDELLRVDHTLNRILEVLPMPHDESLFYLKDEVVRDGNLIVAVTRFTEQKRVDMLVKAMALLSEKSLHFRLHIYGEGDLRQQIVELIDRLGLSEKVSLFSAVPQSELADIYNRAGIVVLNSVREGFGLALSEAMLCGAAVVGTNSGGIPDIIDHDKNGLLVEPDNPSELADNLANLLTDEALRIRLGRSGLQSARSRFTSSASAARYAEIIRNAVRS